MTGANQLKISRKSTIQSIKMSNSGMTEKLVDNSGTVINKKASLDKKWGEFLKTSASSDQTQYQLMLSSL